MKLEPYLFFEGRADEAMDFYRDALGAEVTFLTRFREAPDGVPPGLPEGAADKVMHMAFRIGDGTFLGSDGRCSGSPSFQGFALSLTPPDAAIARRMFEALADGGSVTMPLQETFYSPCFGMVADRFGISWMLMVAP